MECSHKRAPRCSWRHSEKQIEPILASCHSIGHIHRENVLGDRYKLSSYQGTVRKGRLHTQAPQNQAHVLHWLKQILKLLRRCSTTPTRSKVTSVPFPRRR